MTLADKIVVLRDGIIEQVGSPKKLYTEPANTFVAQFIGSPKMNFFGSDDVNVDAVKSGQILGLRPEHLELAAAGEGIVSGVLDYVEYLGETKLAHCTRPNGTSFIAKIAPESDVKAGDELSFTGASEYFHFFDEASGQRLSAS